MQGIEDKEHTTCSSHWLHGTKAGRSSRDMSRLAKLYKCHFGGTKGCVYEDNHQSETVVYPQEEDLLSKLIGHPPSVFGGEDLARVRNRNPQASTIMTTRISLARQAHDRSRMQQGQKVGRSVFSQPSLSCLYVRWMNGCSLSRC